jgi:hypothetical protein
MGPSHKTDEVIELLYSLLGKLRKDPERNESTQRIINEIEDERAALLAAKMRRRTQRRGM